jgi:hypothetical protein
MDSGDVVDVTADGDARLVYGRVEMRKPINHKEHKRKHKNHKSLWDFSVFFCALCGAIILLVIGSLFLASAHEGPPYPILVDKKVGPCLVSVWADPDVGIGTFFIILDPPKGGTLPQDVTVEIDVRPVSGRLAEARYQAQRENLRDRLQFKAEVPFDAQERWLTRIRLKSSQGGGEEAVEVEVTPPGYGRWDLLWYLSPFLAVGFLWLKAFLRGRSRKKKASQQIK